MKQAITPSYTFNAAARTVDLSSIVSFSIKRLYAIINTTANQVIYATGVPSLGATSVLAGIVTLVYDTTSMSNSDVLMIIYDTVNTDIANSFVTRNTDGTNSQSYTASGEAKVLVTPLTNTSVVKSQLQDNAGSAIILGQTLMSSSIPVAIASNQSAIPVSQSGSWSLGRTWNLLNSVDSVNAVQSGIWNINNISGSVSLPTNAAQETGGHLSSIDTKLSDDLAGNLKVNLQTAIPAGANNIGSVNAVQSGTWNITNISGTVSLPTNAAVESGGHLSSIDSKLADDGSGNLKVNLQTAIPAGANNIGSVNAVQSGTWTVQQGTPPWSMVGNVGSGSADSGNPVKVGGVFNSALPTLTNGQRGDIQLDSSARQIIAPLTNTSVVKAQLQDNAGSAIVLGQTTMSASVPVAIASNQSAIPASQSGTWNITNISGTVSLPTGASTEATLSALNAKFNSLGQKTMANSVPVVISSDQSAVQVIFQADSSPATQSITAQDTGTGTTTGANGQNIMTGTPTAGSVATFSLSSWETLEVQVTGIWTGTLVSEVSFDGGTTWYNRGMKQAGVQYIASSFTANFEAGGNMSGVTNFRIRSTAAWTGTATVKVILSENEAFITVTNPQTLRDGTTQSITNTIKAASTASVATDTALVVALSPNSPVPAGTNTIGAIASDGATASAVPAKASYIGGNNGGNLTGMAVDSSGNVQVVGNVASGSADSGNPVKAGGVYNTTLPSLSAGQRGNLQLGPQAQLVTTKSDGWKATYSASVTGLALATTATDFFTITGSASKTIRITKIHFTGNQGTASYQDVVLLKRSTANSAGTSTTQTAVPYDSASAAATATVRAYTANPTTGNLVGNLRVEKVLVGIANGGGINNQTSGGSTFLWQAGENSGQAIVLRGTSEVLALNFNGQSAAGSSCDCWVEWTEE